MGDDPQLLQAWRGGDKHAGVTLFERHYHRLKRFFHNKTADDDRPDLIQRTLLRCLEAREKIHTNFACFLLGTARNVLLEHYREKAKTAKQLDISTMSMEDSSLSASAIIARDEQSHLLLTGLRRIPIESQILLELYYWERMVARQLAELLNKPEGTVRSKIRRAKQQLEVELENLARSPAILESTVSNLEGWANSLRKQL